MVEWSNHKLEELFSAKKNSLINDLSFACYILKCLSVAPSYAEDAMVSLLSVVNLVDDTSSIQIASLGTDLCQCDGTLGTAKAKGFM